MLTHEEMKQLMLAALEEAECGMREGEVPIGCVLARPINSRIEIVGRGHNRVNALQRKIAHAEIITFENAGVSKEGKPPTLPLNATNIILVSTLEPCVMCLGAAMEAGVSLVVYGLDAPADNGTSRVKPPQSPESSAPEIIGQILASESRRMLEVWLKANDSAEQAKFVRQLLSLTHTKREHDEKREEDRKQG